MKSVKWIGIPDTNYIRKLGEVSSLSGEENNLSWNAGKIIGSKKMTRLFLIKRKLTSMTPANQIERSIFKCWLIITYFYNWRFLLIDLKTVVSNDGRKFVENKVWDFIIKHYNWCFALSSLTYDDFEVFVNIYTAELQIITQSLLWG